ncbi:dockerin type I domain-containing protein [Candidatus Nucleicultrix amoebiphila]|jgi:hypothetical protein|nr:EF-hand domain-containing protein [Candidatus Nucleicultrix amoebiphila]
MMTIKIKYLALALTSVIALSSANPSLASSEVKEDVGASTSGSVTSKKLSILDINGDGRVDSSDFKALVGKLSKFVHESVARLLHLLDVNGDGQFNGEDLKLFFSSKLLDINHDGKVDLQDALAAPEAIIRAATTVSETVVKAKDVIETSDIFAQLPARYKDTFVSFIERIAKEADSIKGGAKIANDFGDEMAEKLSVLKTQWASDKFDPKKLTQVTDVISGLLHMVQTWEGAKDSKNVVGDKIDSMLKILKRAK